ncbi:receptor-like protein 6 [Rhododendron vialii]|uniref:receptor-like protein 6 n=1 Tax=Rhododendron vialii TaxID=182163 RepID=UPI00265EB2BC|nr:receptor-like protein 6 [Rhododendron vialii]
MVHIESIEGIKSSNRTRYSNYAGHDRYAEETLNMPLCHEDERSALLQFKRSFDIKKFASGNPSAYPKIKSWKLDANASDCCSWDGVECDHDTSRVIGLDLSSSFLYGSINSNSSLFSLIPSEISSLSQLTFLNLSQYFEPVHATHVYLLKLEKPSLRDLIQNLTNLKVLDLNVVNVSSTVPGALSTMTSLTHLNLGNCILYGEFPMGIFHLPNLRVLRVSVNENLFGYLPEFPYGGPFEELKIWKTNFSGLLPNSIGNLHSLKELHLGESNFYGTLPSSLGNLAQLTFLDVVGSNFWGQVPSSIANLSKLTVLGLGHCTFDARPLEKLSKLIILALDHTKLRDVLPQSLANMTQLSTLILNNNELFGEIPSWLLNLTRLTFLDLSKNRLSGMFPSSISPLKHLEYLDFSFNRLQGPLPLPPPSVLYYRVTGNLLTGKIPTSFCQNRTLFALDLSDNNLSGAIPQCLFKHSFHVKKFASGDPSAYPKVESWGNASDCCSWDGVECDHDTGRVIGLDLSSNFLFGSINSNSSLFSLVHLQTLNLADNHFNYSQIPARIENLSRLKSLNLYNSYFSGQIPSEISSLSQLTFLDLSRYFDPLHASNEYLLKLEKPNLRDLIQNLTNLEVLDLNVVNVSSIVPSALSNMTTLTHLNLGNCLLCGEFPMGIFRLPNLRVLGVSVNENLFGYLPEFSYGSSLEEMKIWRTNFSGLLPNSIGNLDSLTVLEVGESNFYGTLPSSLGNLAQLWFLDVVGSNFWGQVPSSIANLSKLTWLGLGGGSFDARPLGKLSKLIILDLNNTKLRDELPESLANMTQLSTLILNNNELFGEIPFWLLNLTRLTNLDLSENQLSGMFPSSISQLKHLEYLDFSFNRLQGPLPLPPPSLLYYRVAGNLLTGEIPPSFCQNSALLALDLSDNHFSGAIPQCLASTTSDSLLLLNLSNNNFHGTVPEMSVKGIKMIDLSQNQLHGGVPRSLASCTTLEILVLGDNQIEDFFPFWLGSLPELQVLILRSNRFHGAIENPKTNLKFPKLRIIDLSHNGFSGTLPSEYFQNWNAMKLVGKENSTYMQVEKPLATGVANIVYLEDFTYSITISNKGTKLLYEKIQSVFVAVDLSDNKFCGEIPESLGSLGGLQALNISKNNLTGIIPSSLANLSDLESLDLSRNLLSGEIPEQLTKLTFLSVLNVSHNRLTGPIPRGKQFDTFDNSSYGGNMMVIMMGYGSGLIVGLVIGQTLTTRIRNNNRNQSWNNRGGTGVLGLWIVGTPNLGCAMKKKEEPMAMVEECIRNWRVGVRIRLQPYRSWFFNLAMVVEEWLSWWWCGLKWW